MVDDDDDLTLEEIGEKIRVELEKWHKYGVSDPGEAININAFALDTHHFTLVDMLVEAGLIDKDEYQWRYALNSLRRIRSQFEGFKKFADEQRRQAMGVPKMIIPRGSNRKH